MIVQPSSTKKTDLALGCSVIIPCYNEENNVENAVRRIPKMGIKTEIIVVNDGSSDSTAQKVRILQKEFPDVRLIDYYPNRGKGYAVHLGFKSATQEVLMILDADLSVSPEELPRFFEPLNRAQGQFVNGTRMVYPMEKQAMRVLNLLGNKLFGLTMTFITGQNLTDTLCGTKAFYRSDYNYFDKGMDKWGDFDLLFSAARMGLKILEVPVHYKERKNGKSKMRTFSHAFHLLGVVYKGFKKLVFIRGEN
jgi:glycosyltransferase involved in cell wall biosynthesis